MRIVIVEEYSTKAEWKRQQRLKKRARMNFEKAIGKALVICGFLGFMLFGCLLDSENTMLPLIGVMVSIILFGAGATLWKNLVPEL